MNIAELKSLNYEEGVKLLKANGYYKSGENDEKTLTEYSDRVSDIYFTNEEDENDTYSYVTYYNAIGNESDGEIEVVRQGWERVE